MNINFKNRILPFLVFALFLLGTGNLTAVAQYNNNGNYDNYNNSYQIFYDDLAPYGQWLQDPQYGYVWLPNAGSNFRPYYTNGYWAMTDYGNMWVSNYPWGWAPFHYGRWIFSDYYGWAWIPGSEWGPAWVTWRQGGGYYGWAPMMPGVSIQISFGNNYYVPQNYWTFIPYNRIYTPSFQRYNSPRRNINIYNNTTIINNTYVDNRSRNTYVTGPRRSEVRATIGRDVPVYQVNPRNSAGTPTVRGSNIEIYRPVINVSNSRTAAPREVKAVKQSIAPNRNSVQNTNQERINSETPNRNTQPVKRQVSPVIESREINNSGNSHPAAPSTQRSAPAPQRQAAPSRSVPVQAPKSERAATPIERRAAPVQRQAPVRETQSTPAVERRGAPARTAPAAREIRSIDKQESRTEPRKSSSR